MNQLRNQKLGFTLLEVLVAALILFMVLSGATLVYSSSVKSRISAQNALMLHGLSPVLQEHVMVQVRNGELTGQEVFWEASYNWRAKMQQQKAIVANNPVSREEETRQATLYEVDMTLGYNEREETFSFSVVGWETK